MTEETQNTSEGTQEDSIETLEIEYKNIFNRLKTTYQAFVTDYLKTFDSKVSAIAAGYSSKSAVKQGSRLCRNKNISLCISLQQRINSLRGKITSAWVIKELKKRYKACVLDKREQAATANLNLIGQHLGMFGKGKEGGDLHLHDHKKYVNYPPVPESIAAWVEQMKQVGYEAALPVEGGKDGESDNGTNGATPTKEGRRRQGIDTVMPVTSEEEDGQEESRCCKDTTRALHQGRQQARA